MPRAKKLTKSLKSAKYAKKPRSVKKPKQQKQPRRIKGKGELSSYFKNLWNAMKGVPELSCVGSKQSAQTCLYSIQAVYPDLTICKPLGHTGFSHLPDVSSSLPAEMAGVVTNKANDEIIGVQKPDGSFVKFETPIEIPQAPSLDGFHVGDLPKIVPDSKKSETKLIKEIENAPQIASDELRDQIEQAIVLGNDVPSAPSMESNSVPMAPPISMVFDGNKTTPIINKPSNVVKASTRSLADELAAVKLKKSGSKKMNTKVEPKSNNLMSDLEKKLALIKKQVQEEDQDEVDNSEWN